MAASATAAVCEERVSAPRERRPCGGPAGATLGQLLAHAYERAGEPGAKCPVCAGALERDGAAASCGDCGSRLL